MPLSDLLTYLNQIPEPEGEDQQQHPKGDRVSGMTKRFYETEHVLVVVPERAIAYNAWLFILSCSANGSEATSAQSARQRYRL
jgi:hypothetical protein